MSELPGAYTPENYDMYGTAEKKKKEDEDKCQGASCTVSGGRRRRRSRRGRKSRGRKSRRSRKSRKSRRR